MVEDPEKLAEKERQADAYDAYTQQYGENWFFWPLEAQKDALGENHHVPKGDELTRDEAVEMALKAIEAKYGEEALTQLGDYQVGVICCMYEETEGPRYSWELYITSDPEFMSNGFRVWRAQVQTPASSEAFPSFGSSVSCGKPLKFFSFSINCSKVGFFLNFTNTAAV